MKRRIVKFIFCVIFATQALFACVACMPNARKNEGEQKYVSLIFKFDYGIEKLYDGKEFGDLILASGSDIANLKDEYVPEIDSHTFDGWYTSQIFTESSRFVFDKMPEQDTILYAKWIPRPLVTLSFDTDHRVELESITYYAGADISRYCPDMSNFAFFGGWFINKDFKPNNEFTFEKMPGTDTILFAKWLDLTINTTFIVNGEMVAVLPSSEASSYVYIPSKPDLSIEGWYTQNNIGTADKVDLLNDDLSNLTLYGNLYSDGLVIEGNSVLGYEQNAQVVVVPWAFDGEVISEIAANAFSDKDMYSVTLPTTVIEIGNRAFYECRKLQSINLEEGLEKLGDGVFADCVSLTELYIPDSLVTPISSELFIGCNSLVRFNFGAFNTQYKFYSGVIYNKSVTEVIMVMPGIDSVTLAPSVMTIKEHSLFSYKLEEIYIGENVSFIENNVINIDTSVLRKLTLPAVRNSKYFDGFEIHDIFCLAALFGAESYEDNFIYDLDGNIIGDSKYIPDSLEEVVILNNGSVDNELTYSFYGCGNLRRIFLPDGITKIGKYCFYECGNLESMSVPASVEIIEEGAFADCKRLNLLNIGSLREGSALKLLCADSLKIADGGIVNLFCDTPPDIAGEISPFSENIIVCIPEQSLDTYLNASEFWKTLGDNLREMQL